MKVNGLHAHWLASGLREQSAQVFEDHFLLVAEAAADARLIDVDALDRQADQRRDDAANMEGYLSAGTDDHALVFIPVGDAGMRLEVSMLLALGGVLTADHFVGFCESGLDVANAGLDVMDDVVLAVEDAVGIRFVMKTAYATIKGIEVMRALRKGQASAFYYGDPLGEMRLVSRVFEM